MRVLLDTNIYISYLLPSRAAGTMQIIIGAAFTGGFTLLLPEDLVREFGMRIDQKPYLANHIHAGEAQEFLQLLREVAEIVPAITQPIPAISRDPKDNYLLAYAVIAQANYLVTGDHDLLVLGTVEMVQIVTPAQFAALLQQNR